MARRSKSAEQDEINLSLRTMIWQALCEDEAADSQIIAFNIFDHPRWRDHISQLSRLVGVPDDDFSSIHGIVSWEDWRVVFRNEPDLVKQIRLALAGPSRRLTVCTVNIRGDTYEITFLEPLRPNGMN